MTKEERILSQKIFFVGKNISRHLFSKYLEEGRIEQLTHTNADGGDPRPVSGCGILANMDPGLKRYLLGRFAIRIASQIYRSPGIALTGLSAVSDTPVGGAIHLANLSGASRQSRAVEGVFIAVISNVYSVSQAFVPQKRVIVDDLGDIQVNTMPLEAVFLTSFIFDNRKKERNVLRPIISTDDRVQMLRRLVARHDGDVQAAWRSVAKVAKALGVMDRDIAQAKAFIIQQSRGQTAIYPKVRLDVLTNYPAVPASRIGQILSAKPRLDGEATWQQDAALEISSLHNTPTYRFPVFLETLLPERFGVVDDSDRSRIYPLFGRYRRYMNNISICLAGQPNEAKPDVHETCIDLHVDAQRVFSGRFIIDADGELAPLAKLAFQAESLSQPAVPGVQDKIALNLNCDGLLSVVDSIDKSFTHILKFGQSPQMEAIQAGEWFCAHLMRSAGIRTADFALVEIDHKTPLCFLSERFDIAHRSEAGVQRFFEDGCAILGAPIHRKYAVPMESLASRIYAICQRNEDADQFLRQVVASFFLGNTDAHARNFGVLTSVDSLGIPVTRLAPAFDVVCTIGLPWITSAPALAINKSRAYNMASFVFLGAHLRMQEIEVVDTVADVAEKMRQEAKRMLDSLPAAVARRPRVIEHLRYIDQLIDMAGNHILPLRNADLPLTPQKNSPRR